MQKLKKLWALIVLCVKKPSTLWKGFVYLLKYGLVGFRDQTKRRAAYELEQAKLAESVPLEKRSGRILFSILMPVYNVEIKWLKRAIESIQEQNYTNWELCLVDDCSTDPKVREYLSQLKDEKIHVKLMDKNGGISAATNEAAAMASGQYFALMDNDDEIAPTALSDFYDCIERSHADIVYSDQDIIDEKGNHQSPLYKPDWSPELFHSQMYLGHLIAFTRELFEKVGGFRSEYNGSQDYDLLLRMTIEKPKIEHVKKVLYSWRSLPTSTATNPDAKPYSQIAGQKALQDYFDKAYGPGYATVCETDALFVYDVKYAMPVIPKVSIIIPTKDHVELLKAAVDSIFQKTDYPDYEIIILNNNSKEDATYRYFEAVQKEHDNVRVEEAFYEFNWSKLNNHGIRLAKGDVFVCLNNDVEVISPDWLRRLASHVMRDEIGTAGGLLLYEDGTIQHAGIVVGMGGWADHVFKGMNPVHMGTPYVSPMVTRNVVACTGACLAFSRKTYEKIGGFDERFIICGSDVELSIRARMYGLRNVYDPQIRLTHYESKSRDSYIPEIDFKLSDKMYAPYREKGDPYFNPNLDYYKCQPTEIGKPSVSAATEEKYMAVYVPEVHDTHFRKVTRTRRRLNLMLPSINPEHVFGGISTALKFFEQIRKEKPDWDYRIVLMDAEPRDEAMEKYKKEFELMLPDRDAEGKNLIVPFSIRENATLAVSSQDVFLFTGWWTAYCVQHEYRKQAAKGLKPNPFLYFIQDYEPGFYNWSSHYVMADSTYRSEFPQVAIFNSNELAEFFKQGGYHFFQSYVFDPVLNDGLKKALKNVYEEKKGRLHKKKKILVYGRPSIARNAFEIVVDTLREWAAMADDAKEWELCSAGEAHKPVVIDSGLVLRSVGKLSIEDYAAMLEETYAGVSLMVSPHPSYPPLEMAVFGAEVVTNTYGNKDLTYFDSHIHSVPQFDSVSLARELKKITDGYREEVTVKNESPSYTEGTVMFPFLKELTKEIDRF